jgi:hypothetical protein
MPAQIRRSTYCVYLIFYNLKKIEKTFFLNYLGKLHYSVRNKYTVTKNVHI